MNTTLLGYFCLGKTLPSSKNNINCRTTDQGLASRSKCEVVIVSWCLLFWRQKKKQSLCDINFRTLGSFLLAVSAGSLHVLPLSHSLCLPVTLFSSWLACLSSRLSVADVNGPRQHVLFATCVATCVTMGEVLFFFFSRASFYFCLSQSLDLSHIKSLLHVFPLGAWCPPCRGHVQSSKLRFYKIASTVFVQPLCRTLLFMILSCHLICIIAWRCRWLNFSNALMYQY